MEDIKNFKCKFMDIVGLAFDESNFEDYSEAEIEEMVKEHVIISKINTVGVEEWVNSFFTEGFIEEVK